MPGLDSSKPNEVTNPFHNVIERPLKDPYYCVNFGKQLEQGYLDKIGIRKFGSDRMMIDQIFARHPGNHMFFRLVDKTHAKEYTFKLDYKF